MPTTTYDLSACCCGPDLPIVDCSECNPAPLRYNFTIDGVTDGSCSQCNVFNGSYLVEWLEGCIWSQNAIIYWCNNANFYNTVRVVISGGQMSVAFYIVGEEGGFLYLSAKSTILNCQGRTVIDTLVVNNTNCDVSAMLPFNVDAV